jgi:uncharacterized protein YdeI (BOF family)
MSAPRTLLAAALVAATLAGPVPALAADPKTEPVSSTISVTGKVAAVADDQFTLDYGDDIITVEMNNWDFYRNNARIKPGETVAVRGTIDTDWYDKRMIDAASVYVYDRHTYYYPHNAGSQQLGYMDYNLPPAQPSEGTWYGLSGLVKAINGTELTLDTGVRDVTIETAHLGYNPLDTQGYQQVHIGDTIYVTGVLDHSFFDNSEIEAKSITTLSPDTSKTVTTVTRTTTTSSSN